MQCQSMLKKLATLLTLATLTVALAGGAFAPAYAAPPTVVTVTDSNPDGWAIV